MGSTEKYTESYRRVECEEEDLGLRTVGDCMKYFAEVQGNKYAVIFGATVEADRETVTWLELYENSCVFAKALINLGIKRDEIVGINIRPCPEWLYVTFGCMLAGIKAVGLAFTYTDGSDLIAMMNKLKTCSMLVLDPGASGENWKIVQRLLDAYSKTGRATSSKMSSVRFLLGHRFPTYESKVRSLQEVMANAPTDIEIPKYVSPDDIAFLFQTSGSTGLPKLVAHTHASMLGIGRMKGSNWLRRDAVLFNDRPFNWIGGFPISVFCGNTRVAISGFTELGTDRLSAVIEIITRERCTVALGLPPMIHALIKQAEDLPKNWPIKTLLTGSQPVTKALTKAIGKPCKTLEAVYGCTEFFLSNSYHLTDPDAFPEFCCGPPWLSNGLQVKVVNKEEETVPINTRGELWFKGPVLMKEYFHDPEKTAKAITPDMWFKTDDFAMMDEDGLFYVFGRISNMIISGGMNVVPEILETAIKGCPGIDNVVVVPVSDPVYYQSICACVILKRETNTTEDDIRQFCDTHHNDRPGLFTVLPKFYMFLDAFPETRTGKTSRKDLQAVAEEKFGNYA
ncbi:long-chain-fatty-acid--CoA ligase FadD13-like [Mya arenaria]|nr:long-chain-fatty-acid--CoA ligase FadD13-like [Mya arenaria]